MNLVKGIGIGIGIGSFSLLLVVLFSSCSHLKHRQEGSLPPPIQASEFATFLGLEPGSTVDQADSLFGQPSHIEGDFHTYYAAKLWVAGLPGSGQVYGIQLNDWKAVEGLKVHGVKEPKLEYYGLTRPQIFQTFGTPTKGNIEVDGFVDFIYEFKTSKGIDGAITYMCPHDEAGECDVLYVNWKIN